MFTELNNEEMNEVVGGAGPITVWGVVKVVAVVAGIIGAAGALKGCSDAHNGK